MSTVTISGAAAHSIAAATDRIPASKAGVKGYLTPLQLSTFENTLAVGSVGVRVLWVKTAANMNSTADQALTKVGTFTNFIVTGIRAANPSTNLTLAVGGVYQAASKAGNALVANTQVYSALAASTDGLNLTQTSTGNGLLSASALYLSLTTAQGGAATADLYVLGVPLS